MPSDVQTQLSKLGYAYSLSDTTFLQPLKAENGIFIASFTQAKHILQKVRNLIKSKPIFTQTIMIYFPRRLCLPSYWQQGCSV